MSKQSTLSFSEFKSINLIDWETKIEKDLKGKPLSVLSYKPEHDLNVKAYYHLDEFKNRVYSKGNNLNQNNNDWFITELIKDNDSKTTNKIILNSLNKGATGVKIITSESTDFAILFKDVLLPYAFIHIVVNSELVLKSLNQFIIGKDIGHTIIESPILTKGLNQGNFDIEFSNIYKWQQITASIPAKTILINGIDFVNYGATSTQELAIILAQLNEYFEALNKEDVQLKDIVNRIAIELGTSANYFVNLAKFRAVKELTLQLYAQWNLSTHTLPWLSAQKVERNITINDRHNNLLRQTTETMSTIMGGVQSLTIKPYGDITENDQELSARMARNIQLVLKEESYVHQVIDPAAGSYVVESLTDQLIENAWALFMDIESKGGFVQAVKSNQIQNWLNKSKSILSEGVNTKTETLLGVNKYPDETVEWKTHNKLPIKSSGAFKAFEKFNLEQTFEL